MSVCIINRVKSCELAASHSDVRTSCVYSRRETMVNDSYEDCVAGAHADVVVFYRQGDDEAGVSNPTAKIATPAAAVSGKSTTAGPSLPTREPKADVVHEADSTVLAAVIASAKCCPAAEGVGDGELGGLPLAIARPGSLETSDADGAPTVTATTSAVGDCLRNEGNLESSGEALLTIIVRPLPSTAPASLDSDSCTGEG